MIGAEIRDVPRELLGCDEVLNALREAPSRIAALTAGIGPEQLRATPAEGEWSAIDILAHLRACADIGGGCIDRIVPEDHPTIRSINPRKWITQTNYGELEFAVSLRDYLEQRAELLAILKRLPSDGWSRSARVTGTGARRERTVETYAGWLARHERAHLKPLDRTIRRVSG